MPRAIGTMTRLRRRSGLIARLWPVDGWICDAVGEIVAATASRGASTRQREHGQRAHESQKLIAETSHARLVPKQQPYGLHGLLPKRRLSDYHIEVTAHRTLPASEFRGIPFPRVHPRYCVKAQSISPEPMATEVRRWNTITVGSRSNKREYGVRNNGDAPISLPTFFTLHDETPPTSIGIVRDDRGTVRVRPPLALSLI